MKMIQILKQSLQEQLRNLEKEALNKPTVDRTVSTLSIQKKLIALFSLLLITLFVASAIYGNEPLDAPTARQNLLFEKIPLSARAVFIYDVESGQEIWSKNSDTQLPLASITKIMTTLTALSSFPPATVITMEPNILAVEGDSGLYGNERWNLKDLLTLTLLESSNDGAYAVASAIKASEQDKKNDTRDSFIEKMNIEAREMGLEQTYFLNATGLDVSDNISGGYGSARDVALMFSQAIKKYPDIFGTTRYESRDFISLSEIKHSVKNTNKFVDRIPFLLASKTGYTDLAGGNLVIALDPGPGKPVVISILGSTEEGRFSDAEKLSWATLEYLHN